MLLAFHGFDVYRLSSLPQTPDFGRAETAYFGAAESGTCEDGFRQVFARGL
jgi:hypothetical protein